MASALLLHSCCCVVHGTEPFRRSNIVWHVRCWDRTATDSVEPAEAPVVGGTCSWPSVDEGIASGTSLHATKGLCSIALVI